MNGPLHYRVAEKLLETAVSTPTAADRRDLIGSAQAHATLALAAATARQWVPASGSSGREGYNESDRQWGGLV